ncbi:HAD hydrolase family protein [Streptococcus pluranimalium]|uniref:HAD hydrolase family protein n=1 Tax=Streptococcus pluranimalium TaxID=82348 RepID=UPI003F69088F
MSTDVIRQVIAFVEKEIPQAQLLLSGEKSAYVKISMLQVDKDYFKIYYHQFREVPSFEMLPDDNFLKLSINIPPKKTTTINDYFNKAFPGQITGTSSGNGNIDLIATGVHKGAALGYLLAKWGLSSAQLATFGDGGNDIEMLAMTDYSYAMANGSDKVKAVANFQALSNDQSGIEDLLHK